MSLASYYRQAFTAHAAVPVVAPWPFGHRVAVLWVRPDYVSPFVEGLVKLGIPKPETYAKRAAARQESAAISRASQAKDARKQLLAAGRGKEIGRIMPVAELLENMAQSIEDDPLPDVVALTAEGWDLRYPIYTRAEIEAVAELVGLHLVDRGGLVPAGWTEQDGDGDLEPWGPDEIAGLFEETEPVPVVDPDRQDGEVPFAGEPERIAWAVICLRVAVQRHLYLERAVPLGSGSPEQAPPADTLSENGSFPTESPPD